MPNKPRLTYANIVSTLALFLALGGSAAFAASKINSGDIAHNAVKSANLAPGSVHTSKIFKRAIVSGKLALGAVRSNQIAAGAVDAERIGNGAVGSKQIGDAAVAPSNLQFPVFYAASPKGGSAPVTNGPDTYPIANDTWTQNPGEIEVVFGGAVATLAYDGSGSGSCRVSSKSTSTANRSAAAKSRPNRQRSSRPNRASALSRRSIPSIRPRTT
jgi:hypothetical protein